MREAVAPIGTVIHLTAEHEGSWLKINHGVDTPADLLVKHFADAKNALDENAALRVDAERWRGILASERIRPMGSAGIDSPGDYAHLGLELWTTYPESPEKQNNKIGIDWLTKFADKCRVIQAARSKEDQACSSGS